VTEPSRHRAGRGRPSRRRDDRGSGRSIAGVAVVVDPIGLARRRSPNRNGAGWVPDAVAGELSSMPIEAWSVLPQSCAVR
jgi:hypothetical protein